MEKEAEKYCGNCCWFYAEDTDGYGLCPSELMETKRCDEPCTNGEFVSKKEMRHHMAVLLQYHMADEDMNHRFPGGDALEEAIVFAYKYIKTFSRL